MIYALFIGLAILAVFCYRFAGKDYFTPSTVQITIFAGATIMCIWYMWSLNCPYEFHAVTIGIIFATMALSAAIGIAVHQAFAKVEVKAHTPQTIEISPIPDFVSVLFILALIISNAWLLSEIWRIGGGAGNFNQVMHEYHQRNSYSTDPNAQLPFLLRQFINLWQVVPLLYAFQLIRFWGELKKRKIALSVAVMALCAMSMLLEGVRIYLVYDLIGFIMLFHLLRIQRQGGYQKYSFKSLMLVGAVLAVILVGFYATKSIVGRTSLNETLNIVDYIAYYTGSPLIALDVYLLDPITDHAIWGKETFAGVVRFLIRYHLIDLEQFVAHKEYRYVGAGHYNNVYTFIRTYHADFGIAGVFILHVLMMLLMSLFYEYVKKKRSNISILIFSLIYYSVVMTFFNERFISDCLTVLYVKKAAMLLIMYAVFLRKCIPFIKWHKAEANVQNSAKEI